MRYFRYLWYAGAAILWLIGAGALLGAMAWASEPKNIHKYPILHVEVIGVGVLASLIWIGVLIIACVGVSDYETRLARSY